MHHHIARDCVWGGEDPSAGGARIKALNRVGYGEWCPFPSRLAVVSSPSGVQGKAPATVAFSAYSRPQTLLVERKMWLLPNAMLRDYWSNNFCRCPVLGGRGGNCHDCPHLATPVVGVTRRDGNSVQSVNEFRQRRGPPECDTFCIVSYKKEDTIEVNDVTVLSVFLGRITCAECKDAVVCGLLLRRWHGFCVCWSQPWAVLQCLNQWRCF